MNDQQKNEALYKLSSEALMEACLQKIFDDISSSEVKGRVEMRDAALRARTLAEGALTEVRLRKAGLSMFSKEEESVNNG
jgi:hypothetical protein